MPGRGRVDAKPRGPLYGWTAWLIRIVLGGTGAIVFWFLLAGMANAASSDDPGSHASDTAAEVSQAGGNHARGPVETGREAVKTAVDTAEQSTGISPEVPDVPPSGVEPVDDAVGSAGQAVEDSTPAGIAQPDRYRQADDAARTPQLAPAEPRELSVAHESVASAVSTVDIQLAGSVAESRTADAGDALPPIGLSTVDGSLAAPVSPGEYAALFAALGLAAPFLLPVPPRRRSAARTWSVRPAFAPD